MAKKENKPASAYAKPHTMSGGPVTDNRANMSKADTVNMSVGNISKAAGNIGTKTSGIKIRGTGAATKGVMARGPMA